jgi:phenylacetate-coenzyme A ligase PaaK-like adenylate-forming protein
MVANSENLIVEILDDNRASVGSGGIAEAVITNQCSDTQSFIHYRTGDIGRQTKNLSSTGQGLHVISEIIGGIRGFRHLSRWNDYACISGDSCITRDRRGSGIQDHSALNKPYGSYGRSDLYLTRECKR